MIVDPANSIVQLCAQGIAAEGEGRAERARELFAEAWALHGNDHEACIAAHYVARHQTTPEEKLWWNEEALRRAKAVGDDRVRDFYPSLHLNVADSLEQLGRIAEAHEHYVLATARLLDLPHSGYANLIRASAARGEARTRAAVGSTNA